MTASRNSCPESVALTILAFTILVGCRAPLETPTIDPQSSDSSSSSAATNARLEPSFKIRPLFEKVNGGETSYPSKVLPLVFNPPSTVEIVREPRAATRTQPTSVSFSTGSASARRSFTTDRSGDPLLDRLQNTLERFEKFEGKNETDLEYGELLVKRRLERELIAIHYLLEPGHEYLYLDRLLSSLAHPTDPPSKSHGLMVASFYHDIDREDLRDATLRRVTQDGGNTTSQPAAPDQFEVENVKACKKISGFRNFNPIQGRSVTQGRAILLYGEVSGLTNVWDAKTGQYDTGIEATAHVYDGSGTEARRIQLTPPGGNHQTRPERLDNHYFEFPFTIPEGLEGTHRFVIRVTDLNSGRESEGEMSLKVRK